MNPNRQFAKSIREFMEERQSLERGEMVVNEELLNESGVTFRFDIDRKKYQFKFDLKKSPKGDGFIVTPQSMDDIYQLRQNIPDVNISTTIGRLIAKQIEKKTKIPVEYDSFRNNGYFIKIFMTGVIVRILQNFR